MSAVQVNAAAPERSLQQRLDALKRANAIRSYRADLKRGLKARQLSACEVLLDPDDEAMQMPVMQLLFAVPKFGRVKVNRILVRSRISPSKTIGGLSPRQRAELAAVLRGL